MGWWHQITNVGLSECEVMDDTYGMYMVHNIYIHIYICRHVYIHNLYIYIYIYICLKPLHMRLMHLHTSVGAHFSVHLIINGR